MTYYRFAIKIGGSMINKTYLRDILTVVGLSILFTILISRPVFPQDTTKMKGDKKVRIIAKIVEDSNGKNQEFDTTINMDRKLKPGEEQELMKSFRMRMKDLDEQMKDLEAEFNNMSFPDSSMIDSARRFADRALRNWKGHGDFRFNHNLIPREFNYDYHFDVPDFDEPPQKFLKEFKDENGRGDLNEEYQYRSKGEDKSLNDLLGDIPMDKVKRYSIQDTKDGKRIVIELKKDPFIERHRDVIIIRTPRPENLNRQDNPQIRKKVIIKEGNQKDDDDQDNL